MNILDYSKKKSNNSNPIMKYNIQKGGSSVSDPQTVVGISVYRKQDNNNYTRINDQTLIKKTIDKMSNEHQCS